MSVNDGAADSASIFTPTRFAGFMFGLLDVVFVALFFVDG